MAIALRLARHAIFNAPLLGEYEGNAKEIHFQKMVFGLGAGWQKTFFESKQFLTQQERKRNN